MTITRHEATASHAPARMIRWAWFFAVALFVGSAHAQTITVFDDALQNGFADYSFGGNTSMNDATFAHTGTKSASILGHNFNALSFAHAPGGVLTSLHVATTPILRFWVNGGTSSGQQFHLALELNGGIVGISADLDNYINGGGVGGPNVWRQVTIDLRLDPFNAVDFDRIDIQSDEDLNSTDASATYFDDIVLGQPSGGATVSAIQYGQGVTVENMSSETFTWQDSLLHPRVAALAYNDTAPFNGSYGGALREYKFQLSNGQTRTATSTTYGNAGYGGFGYVTDHSSRYAGCVGGDDSPLGMGFGGHWQRIFEGRHHAIFRFTQLYPRYCPTQMPVITRFVPVTIDWIFSTGRDNPVWAVTYDVDLISADGGVTVVGPDMYYDDSRGPYGELNIDGDGFSYDINGTSWGDRYKFIPGNAPGTSMTLNVPWTWNTPNTVPFVKEWIDAALGGGPYNGDATMGLVQTQTMTQQDAGGARDPGVNSDIRPYWAKTDADGITSAGPYKVPNGDNWPYQANGDNLTNLAGNNNARLTWKTQYGFVGQTAYTLNNGVGTTAPGYPKKSYSTYVILGQHSTVPDPVDAQVTQVETVQSLTLSINSGVGSVVTTGPAGITRVATVTYAPAGYNHVYGALAFSANGSNNLDANIAVGSGTLKKPLIIVGNYTAGDPQLVTLGGVTLVADADYFASVRTNPNELWITLNGSLTGATNRLVINGVVGGLGTPTNFVAAATNPFTSQVTISWTAVVGAATYEIQRSVNFGSINNGFTQLVAPIAGTTYNDVGLTANTTYLYKVRAINGGTMSAYTAIDPATTILFTDDPLNPGTVAKATHVSQLRTAVNAVRVAAGLGALPFDATLASGGPIKAVYINELRTALDAARLQIGLIAQGYTDSPTVAANVTPIRAAHITDLRTGVK
jgi:hypothetical protein